MAVPMAFLQQASTRAMVTGYQNNCGLNALVHVLVPKMGEVPRGAPGRAELLTAFNETYGVYIPTWGRLTEILQGIQNPIHRESVLGPVLRKLTDNDQLRLQQPPPIGWQPLAADDVLKVANKFDIKVEGYATHEALKKALYEELLPQFPNDRIGLGRAVTRRFKEILANPNDPNHPDYDQFRAGVGALPRPVAPIATLKLWNVGDHWEYEEANAADTAAHNAAYQRNAFSYTYNYDRDNGSLNQKISEAIITSPARAPDLNQVFRNFEVDNHANLKQNAATGVVEALQNVAQQLPNIANPLQIGGKNNFFAVIGQLLSQIIGALAPVLTGLQDMMKAFRQINKTVESPLDEDDISQNPRLAKETREFSALSNRLTGVASENGKTAAAELNSQWRRNPNSPEVWKKLINTMVENGLLDEADQWLRAQEKQLLGELDRVETELSREPQIVGVPNVNRNQLRQTLAQYRDGLRGLEEDPVLSYTTPKYKMKNFEVRFKMFQACSEDLRQIRDKHKKEFTMAQQIRAKAQLEQDITREARAAHAAGAVTVERSLQARLIAVQQELGELTGQLTNSRNDTTVEDDFTTGVTGQNLLHLAQTHQPAYQRARQAALQKKQQEEAAAQARARAQQQQQRHHRPHRH